MILARWARGEETYIIFSMSGRVGVSVVVVSVVDVVDVVDVTPFLVVAIGCGSLEEDISMVTEPVALGSFSTAGADIARTSSMSISCVLLSHPSILGSVVSFMIFLCWVRLFFSYKRYRNNRRSVKY